MNIVVRRCLLAAAWICLLSSALPAFAQTDSLVLQYPSGGEIFYTNRDTLVTIRWSGVDDTTKVKLEWSTDQILWNIIADSATSLRYDWDVRGLPLATTYRVRVRQVRPPFASDNVIYTGHTGPVFDGSWSPSGDRVVTVSRQPHIWDAEVGGAVPLVTLPSNSVDHSSVVWSADSTRIAAGSADNTARTFDTRTNALEYNLSHPGSVMDVMLDPSSTRLFTSASDDRVRFFQLPQTTPNNTFTPTSTLLEMVVSHDGDRVLACVDRGARVYDISGGLPVQFNAHQSGTLDGSWSPNDSLICTIGGDRTVRLWNAATGIEVWNAIDDLEGVRCVEYSPDGSLIAVGMSDSTVTIWDPATGSQVASYGGHFSQVTVVAWAPQGDLIASAGDDNTIRVHDVRTGRLVGSYLHSANVLTAQWSPEGSRLLTTSDDQTAVIWRVREITLQGDTSNVFSISDPPPAYARFTATGDTINLGDQTTITVSLEDSYNLDLADIDSVEFTLRYDGTMLDRLSSTQPIVSEADSVNHQIVTFKPVALPTSDAALFTVTFRGTLGADSVTSLHFSGVRQIGPGSPIPFGTQSDSILIRGLCRAGGVARLYNPIGVPLQIAPLPSGTGVMVDLAESGPTKIQAYDLLGNLIWSDVADDHEIRDRFFFRELPHAITGTGVLFVVTTPTQMTSLFLPGGR